MKNINPKQWKVIIESIVHSDALKKYQEAFNILEMSKNEYVAKVERLLEQKQKFETKLNSKILRMPFIGQLLKTWINNKIKKCNNEIKQLKNNPAHNKMREALRNVWKEILKHYHDSNINNDNPAMITINSEALAIWQNQFVKHCELLIQNWQDKFKEMYQYQLLVANGKKIYEIVKNLTTDVCSDHEFQKKQLLNIIGNNPFLKKSESTKPLVTNNWSQNVREQCNSTVTSVQKRQPSSYLRYVTRR